MTDESLVSFCRTEYPRLVGMLGLYCGDRAVAEELAQETLARVWRRWPKVHHLERPDAWAQHVAINLARSHFRRMLAERRARAKLPKPEPVPEPDRHDDQAVRDAVSRLPYRQREAVVLHYFLDLPLTEIADRMGTSVSAIKSLLHRAVQRLRTNEEVKTLLEVTDVS